MRNREGLGPADLRALTPLLHTLASPLDFDSLNDWRAEVMRRCQAALGSDQAVFVFPGIGAPVIQPSDTVTARAIDQYGAYYHQLDPGFTHDRRVRGLSVYHLYDLYQPAEFKRGELYADWAQPHKMHDALGMGYDLPGEVLPAALHVFRAREGGRQFGARGRALYRLAVPTFRAGITAARAWFGARLALGCALDNSEEPALVLAAEGRVVHANSAYARCAPAVAASLLPAARRLCSVALRFTGQSLGPRTPVKDDALECMVTANGVPWCLRATVLPPGVFISRPVVLITIHMRPVTASDRARAAGLTPREEAVATLLAGGYSNRAIADRLAIAASTARRHTEAVLRKLGVASRAAVGAALRGGI